MSESVTLVAPGRPMLDYLPIGLFGSVIGLTGLSVAWRFAHMQYGTPGWVAQVIAAVAVLAFASLLACYALKLATAFGTVQAETPL